MQKADLHIHLNGAIPSDVIRDLLIQHNISIPEEYDVNYDLQILEPVDSLQSYFKPWFLIKQLPVGQECLNKMVEAAFPPLKRDNVKYVEFRNSPFNIGEINDISLEETLLWIIEALEINSSTYGIKARLIVSLSRYNFQMEKSRDLLRAIKKVNTKQLIVGLDLSGDEKQAIPVEASSLFRAAKDDLGLGITIHTGEIDNKKNFEWVLDHCQPDRIGHGLSAANSPKILEKIKNNNICIETCLYSNHRTGSIENISKHPVQKFIEWEIPFILCTDNPAIHNATLSDEYSLFNKEFSRMDILKNMINVQTKYAFGFND